MKKTFQLKNLIVSMAIAGSAALSMTPVTAHAEVSYNAAVSNMYLWRGINISSPSPAVSGGADYSHDSGFYAGTWMSSEGEFDKSTEFDLYAGYAPTFGDVTLTFGYNAYFYPDAVGDSFSRDDGTLISEYVLGAAYKDFSVTGYINTELDDANNYKYVSLDYGVGSFGLHYGITMSDDSASEYNDINVSYAATDALTFTLSKAFGDAISDTNEKPMLQLTYALPI